MGDFSKISTEGFKAIQIDAGMLLKKFNLQTKSYEDADIITLTTGGISVNVKPNYSDFGEDIDNCPVNLKELKHLDSWDVSVGFTALDNDPALIKLALGAADIDGTNSAKIVPRRDLEQTDFSDIWWVGDRVDGGLAAVKLLNALSTDGYALQTTKNGKGQVSVTLTGHVSAAEQDVVPIEFYSYEG